MSLPVPTIPGSFPVQTPIRITMEQVLSGYQQQFLDKMLLFSVMYAVLTLWIWWNIDKVQMQEPYKRWFTMFVYLNIITSLYYPLTMLSVYTGWF